MNSCSFLTELSPTKMFQNKIIFSESDLKFTICRPESAVFIQLQKIYFLKTNTYLLGTNDSIYSLFHLPHASSQLPSTD